MKIIFRISLAVLIMALTACGGGSGVNSDDDKEAAIKIAAESLEAEIGLYSKEYAECLLEGILEIATDISWEDIAETLERDGNLDDLNSSLSNDEVDEEDALALALTCAAEADVLQDLMDGVEDVISSGGNYGDDPYLDSLYNQCADGDDWACQLLWEESPIDSEYESFALTCGGRDCDITTLGIPMNYGDDNYLDDLYDSCADGDDWACQLLWEESPIDSEYESFALTCGGRDCEIETPNTVPWGGGSLDLDALYADCSDGNDDACVLLSDLSPDSEIREFAKTCGGRGGDCSSFG